MPFSQGRFMFPDTANDITTDSLPWLASFGVGDDRIDAEHRAMVDAANELCELARSGADLAVLHAAARDLIALVEEHFASEEALFPHIGYTGRQQHVQEHRTILASLQSLLLEGSGMAPPVAAATARLLLIEHILRHDLGFKTWIQVARGP